MPYRNNVRFLAGTCTSLTQFHYHNPRLHSECYLAVCVFYIHCSPKHICKRCANKENASRLSSFVWHNFLMLEGIAVENSLNLQLGHIRLNFLHLTQRPAHSDGQHCPGYRTFPCYQKNLKRSFGMLTPSIFLDFYKMLFSPASSPFISQDSLEIVRKRAVKLEKGRSHVLYGAVIQRLGLFSLVRRRTWTCQHPPTAHHQTVRLSAAHLGWVLTSPWLSKRECACWQLSHDG